MAVLYMQDDIKKLIDEVIITLNRGTFQFSETSLNYDYKDVIKNENIQIIILFLFSLLGLSVALKESQNE